MIVTRLLPMFTYCWLHYVSLPLCPCIAFSLLFLSEHCYSICGHSLLASHHHATSFGVVVIYRCTWVCRETKITVGVAACHHFLWHMLGSFCAAPYSLLLPMACFLTLLSDGHYLVVGCWPQTDFIWWGRGPGSWWGRLPKPTPGWLC